MLFAHVDADNFQQVDGEPRFLFQVVVKRRKFNRVNFGRTLRDGVENVNGIFFVERQFADDTAARRQSQRENSTALGKLRDKNLSVANEEKIFRVVAFVKEIFAGLERENFAGDFVKLSNHRIHKITFADFV